MPVLMISTNVTAGNSAVVLHRLSREVAKMLGKPESYVMVQLHDRQRMLFAGSDAPLAYCELKSIGLPFERNTEFCDRLCMLIDELLGVPPKRVYIEFKVTERHLFGWNSQTF
ncbi:MAG: phenylpyruvate tautomerase MIF-related protein [Gammaproteobacteria bacterium]|jgi:phenylpyruvate tautomerase